MPTTLSGNFRCAECGARFSCHGDLYHHLHGNFICILSLPDGCTPGRWEAANTLAEMITELRKARPREQFQFVPFAYDESGGLKAIMAIAQ